MKDTEEGNLNIWRTGYVNVAEMLASGYGSGTSEIPITRFRFAQVLNNIRIKQDDSDTEICPEECQPVAIGHVELRCEEADHVTLNREECEKKEEPLPGCEFSVFTPTYKGKYSHQVTKASRCWFYDFSD